MVQLRSYIFFFLKMPKMWVGRTKLNGEKKRGWPSNNECKVLSVLGQTEQVVGKLNCGILHSSGETTFKFIKFIKDVGNCRERTA